VLGRCGRLATSERANQKEGKCSLDHGGDTDAGWTTLTLHEGEMKSCSGFKAAEINMRRAFLCDKATNSE
jgi:hypothetical protein